MSVAARVRRMRDRRRRGLVVSGPVAIPRAGLEAMVAAGLLAEAEAGDRQAIGAALAVAVEQWVADAADVPRLRAALGYARQAGGAAEAS